MTHQEKIEVIRKACIAANPEIVELKFGCEFQAGTSTMLYLQTERYAVNNVGFWRAHFCSKEYPMNVWEGERQPSPTRMYDGTDFVRIVKESISQSKAFSNSFPKVEIIGRPITLADVLLAVERSSYDFMGVSSNGRLREIDGGMITFEGYNPCWNLLKALEGQDESTIDFIYKLLKSEDDIGWEPIESPPGDGKKMPGEVG